MRKTILLPALAAALALAACGGKTTSTPQVAAVDSLTAAPEAIVEATADTLALSYGHFEKASKWATTTIELVLPAGQSKAEATIRDSLITLADRELAYGWSPSGDKSNRLFDRVAADKQHANDVISYYGPLKFAMFENEARTDYDELLALGDSLRPEVRQYAHDYSGWRESETQRYIVFGATEYWYTGGAHGQTFTTFATFSKQSGQQLTAFFKPGSEAKMQPLLRKGLAKYFAEPGNEAEVEAQLDDYLMLSSPQIPLPAGHPYPSERGLVLQYGQYEIASYASGMPSLTLSWNEARPFLTAEARALLLGE